MTTTAKAPVDRAKIEAFANAVEAMMAENCATYRSHLKGASLPRIKIEMGRVRARIIHEEGLEGDPHHRSAFCFVDFATGDILKPDGWKRPAKHARGNINTETHGVEFVGPYGPAYLR